MLIHPNILGFEWDKGNKEKNAVKHGVTDRECEGVFFHQPFIVARDTKHSDTEHRFYALGITRGGRRLFLCFTIRRQLIRVISARDMHKKEREIYVKQEIENHSSVQNGKTGARILVLP